MFTPLPATVILLGGDDTPVTILTSVAPSKTTGDNRTSISIHRAYPSNTALFNRFDAIQRLHPLSVFPASAVSVAIDFTSGSTLYQRAPGTMLVATYFTISSAFTS